MAARLQALSAGGDTVFSTWMATDPGFREVFEPFQLATESQLIPGFDDPVTIRRLSAVALTNVRHPH
jgi:hypothetical protein